jgi:hypothetical protein
MLRVEATIGTEDHIPFSIRWAGTGQATPDPGIRHAGPTRAIAARGLNLSGYQVLFGCTFLLGLGGAFLWALKLWLFQP